MTRPTSITTLPYRPNVGLALFNKDRKLLVAQRADLPGSVWQCPQGGVDKGEDLYHAAWREMEEEIGTQNAVLLGEHPDWVTYDLPPHLLGRALGGRFRGQRQKWLVFGFTGTEDDICLDVQDPPEFTAWKWLSVQDILSGNYDLGFKKNMYETLLPELEKIFQDASASKDWTRTSLA
ncbi:RNA pyrophosphohydrolase [Aristophania vespae]|uniref:RNA pyrophosphohydrolase n=1 Tax=Aristophania vespae TaxID=2697033 RepID=A0A6P1NEJ0_9PROT|nr:RNA pyrophosphohydrolase [Aristophania vespae]QHI95868.1 RNA pyrophosphohydrolase [Aristophania vespae]UMM63593.1 RNA pyrophosphohydrolase [Aristophania vespae]